VFPFHTQVLALQLKTVNLHFITSDNVMHKVISIMILAQMMVTDVETVMTVLFELFWNPSCTYFMEVESVMDVS
jgi:hypothetical protein